MIHSTVPARNSHDLSELSVLLRKSEKVENSRSFGLFVAHSHRHEIAFSVVRSGGTPTREEEPLTCASSELGLILSFETLLRGRKEKNDPYLGETQPSFRHKYHGVIFRDTVASWNHHHRTQLVKSSQAIPFSAQNVHFEFLSLLSSPASQVPILERR